MRAEKFENKLFAESHLKAFYNYAPIVHDIPCCAELDTNSAAINDRYAAERVRIDADVGSLLLKESKSITGLQDALSSLCGIPTEEIWQKTTREKRALYLSFPAVIPSLFDKTHFPRFGTNNRVFLVEVPDQPAHSIRFEAISSFRIGDRTIHYCLSIQHRRDEKGRLWQLLRPILSVDRSFFLGRRSRSVHELFGCLSILMSQCNHDYLHGTMMRWFPPPTVDCAPEYAKLMSEFAPSDRILTWERAATKHVSGPIVDGKMKLVSDPLEYWSLLMHRRIVNHISSMDPSALETLELLFREILGLAGDLDSSDDLYPNAGFHLSCIAGFFLSLVAPSSAERISSKENPALLKGIRSFHGDLGKQISDCDSEVFVWDRKSMLITDVLREYASTFVVEKESSGA